MIKLDNVEPVENSDELKPCPFCGCRAVVREMVHEALWIVECSDPKQDDHYAQSYGNTREAAITYWTGGLTMRENMGLYRGKRKDNEEWVEGSYLPETKHSNACIMWHEDGHIMPQTKAIIPETVGQYTGCCDKSKITKVFEGDIVWDEIDERYGVVEFDEGEFIVNFNGNVDTDRFADVINCCYVCGNIHDNPELIK